MLYEDNNKFIIDNKILLCLVWNEFFFGGNVIWFYKLFGEFLICDCYMWIMKIRLKCVD